MKVLKTLVAVFIGLIVIFSVILGFTVKAMAKERESAINSRNGSELKSYLDEEIGTDGTYYLLEKDTNKYTIVWNVPPHMVNASDICVVVVDVEFDGFNRGNEDSVTNMQAMIDWEYYDMEELFEQGYLEVLA